MSGEYKEVFQTYNAGDISFLKSLLDANAIDYIIENENLATVRILAGVPMILKVNIKQLDKVKELLKDFKGGQLGQERV